jgi:predicted RNase H-like nuclease
MKVAGADVWKGKWVVVLLDDRRFDGAFVAPTFDLAVERLSDVAVVGVDIPIGLPESGERRASDAMARAWVGPRWQSVFTTPSADMLEAPSQAVANQRAAARGHALISAQAYGLRKHILEVQPVAALDPRVFEVHPESSFVRANANTHLQWSKSSWNGVNLRRRILETQGILIPDDLAATGAAGVADVLDAAIVAWSADRIGSGTAESFPTGADRIGAIWG